MIHSKRFSQLARKWQRVKTDTGDADTCCATASAVADKGHCAVYTADGKRFEVPLAYLGTMIFSELLRMSQEEFGFTRDGRITLQCDAAVLEYVLCFAQKKCIRGSGESVPEICSDSLPAFMLYSAICSVASAVCSLQLLKAWMILQQLV